MTDFATHKQLLATDDNYRAKLGLPPLNGAPGPAPAPAPPAADDALHHAAQEMLDTAQAALENARTDNGLFASLTGGIDNGLFARIDVLDGLRKDLDRMSKAIKAQVEADQEVLVDMYLSAGTSVYEQGGRVGTLTNQIYARKVDESVTGNDVARALVADGLEHLVQPESYNASQLSAYLRGLDEEHKPIPPHLAEVIEAYETWRVGYTTRRPTRAQRRRDTGPGSVLGGASQD